MAAQHPATLPIEHLLDECEVRRERRSGPGGQHRNKVETAVVLTHRPTGIVAEANERRSQVENKNEAVHRLRIKLAVEVRSNVQPGTGNAASELWKQRCAGGRVRVSTTHDDFPALLAEAIDEVAAAEFDVAAAAARLGVTSSQLAGLLRREPPAWKLVNDGRRALGLRPLH